MFSSSEWDPRLASLLPHPYTWADTEVTHVCSLLHLEAELGLGSDLLTSTMELVTASLVSLGADSWDLTSDSLLWLLGHCLGPRHYWPRAHARTPVRCHCVCFPIGFAWFPRWARTRVP